MTSRTSTSSGRRRIAGAAVLAALLFTSACTGVNAGQGAPSAATSQSPSASASATASATPTPTASYKPADASGKAQNVPVPVLPEVAKTETKEGLEAFARYWFELLSYGYETGDVDRLESLTDPGCEPCSKATSVIGAWHSEGRWIVGGKVTTPSVSTTFEDVGDSTYQVAVQAQQTPLTYVRADGTVARTDPQPDDTGNLLLVAFKNGTWSLKDVGRIIG